MYIIGRNWHQLGLKTCSLLTFFSSFITCLRFYQISLLIVRKKTSSTFEWQKNICKKHKTKNRLKGKWRLSSVESSCSKPISRNRTRFSRWLPENWKGWHRRCMTKTRGEKGGNGRPPHMSTSQLCRLTIITLYDLERFISLAFMTPYVVIWLHYAICRARY